ncbi:MAG: purine-binding chemotaxis protein CheW [Deltaproteobacteria bacterium]|nr:purine-binding chemotaxis protein CheW [Deltaproteobacteria bacterium]
MEKEFSSQRIEEITGAEGEKTPYQEDLYEREGTREETIQLVIFRLSREWYGVEITKVKEAIKAGKITYLPSSPGYIAGIVNLRGNILSVTDLKTILGLPHEEPTEKARILAIEYGMVNTGFFVDEVVESMEVPKSKITSVLPTIPSEVAKYIKGQCKMEDKLIAIINVERILEMKA